MIKKIIIIIQFVNLTSFINGTMIEIYGIAFTMAELILMAAFGVLLLIQLFYFILKARFISGGKKKNREISYPPVSLIIPSRNFEEELRVILPELLTQDYPDFPNALALTLGIRAAANEWMIFLNPLCAIPGKDWLKNYVEHCTSEKEAVFGYVNYSASKGSMHQMIRLENFNSYILSGSARLLGMAMPVNDLNIAYRRTPFLDRKGFAAVLESPFCENELYLKEIATRRNSVYIMNSKACIGYTDEFKWHDFVNFKKKQLLLKQKFTVGQRLYLWIEASSRIAFDILAIILVILSQWRFWIIGIWLFKNTFELIWGIHAMRRLGEKKLFPAMGIFKTFAPVINSIVFFNQLFIGNKSRWK